MDGAALRVGDIEDHTGRLARGKGIAQNLTKGLLSVSSILAPEGVALGNQIIGYAEDAGLVNTQSAAPASDMSIQNTQALNQMVGLMQQLVDGGMNVAIEGEAADIFRVVEKQNRVRTKATGYNSLAMAGG